MIIADDVIPVLIKKTRQWGPFLMDQKDETCIKSINMAISPCNYRMDNFDLLHTNTEGVIYMNRLYLGTWQYGGGFKSLTDPKIENLITHALSCGITQFETAAVYGAGNVEKILGKLLHEHTKVITKVPAMRKPPKDKECTNVLYGAEHVKRIAHECLDRLQASSIYALLFHNWHRDWNRKGCETLGFLQELKEQQLVKKIGISLPNGYKHDIPIEMLKMLDVIEAPYNSDNRWVEKQIPVFKDNNIEILIRSIFLQGKLLKQGRTAPELVHTALTLETNLVIGMTTQEQIENNVSILKGETI